MGVTDRTTTAAIVITASHNAISWTTLKPPCCPLGHVEEVWVWLAGIFSHTPVMKKWPVSVAFQAWLDWALA